MVIAVAGTILDAPPPSDGSVLTRVERGLAKLAGRPDEG
jgi:hypothetical protein